ncbi:MAG TPA: hypothetical protein VLA72_04815 [Anaerolineales bacterium]|nr:hypothetical protein [Anaerolineales bacterium]
MNISRQFIVTFLILATLLSIGGSANAQSDVQYFSDTGHYLRGVFLQFYNAANNPQLVYGSPITEQFEARDGKTVQYFHKVRFELADDNSVQLTNLGQLLYKPQNPLPISSTNGCQQYGEHNVCFTFLGFYKSNGENNQFGYPISSFEYAPNGLIVQSFEGARFEWHPTRNPDVWIVLSDLGRQYFDQQKEDPAQLKRLPPTDATIGQIPSLKVRAFVLKAVTLKSGQQTIYVTVQDDVSKESISNATITATVHLSNGDLPHTFFTNPAGIGHTTFAFNDQKPGELITIDITVSYQGVSITTTTSFRVWF